MIRHKHSSQLSVQDKGIYLKYFSYLAVLSMFHTDLRENFVSADFNDFNQKANKQTKWENKTTENTEI